MQRKFLLIGAPDVRISEAKKLHEIGFDHTAVHHLDNNESLNFGTIKNVLEKRDVTDVVCIETRNGSTGHWALELRKTKIKNRQVVIHGINIPPHPQRALSKGMELVRKINCVKEIFSK